LAEDLHAELLGHPQSLKDLAKTMDPKLESRDAKIKTRAFVEKFSDLFKLENDNVYALVLSHPKARSKKEVRIEPMEEPPRPNVQVGGSSTSTDRPNQAALHFRGVLAPNPKIEKLDPGTAAKNLAEHRATSKKERLEKYAKETQAKMLRQADRIIKRGV
jgi:hypothetical protein